MGWPVKWPVAPSCWWNCQLPKCAGGAEICHHNSEVEGEEEEGEEGEEREEGEGEEVTGGGGARWPV